MLLSIIFMKNYFLLFSPILLLTAWRQTYILYALLKAAGGNDAILGKAPPLTEPGKERAEALKKILKQKISVIFFLSIPSAPDLLRNL